MDDSVDGLQAEEASLEETVVEAVDEAGDDEADEAPATRRPTPRATPSAAAVTVSVPEVTSAPIAVGATAGQQVSTRSPVLPAIIVGCLLALAAAGVLAVRRRAL